jgi:NADH-quinone oxidoreductase subunit J
MALGPGGPAIEGLPATSSASEIMLGSIPFIDSLAVPFPAGCTAALATVCADMPFPPGAILALCVIAGFSTFLLLPGRRDVSIRRIGGTLLVLCGLIFALHLVRYGIAVGQYMNFYFWIFAAIALFGAARVVTHPRPVYSALYFVLTVFATSGLFILLWAEFMAAALVLIYAGAILVTYVFVIMLAAQASAPGESAAARMGEYDTASREPFVAAVAGFAIMGMLLFVIFDKANGLIPPLDRVGHQVTGDARVHDLADVPNAGNTQELGVYLFRDQLVNLELASVLLTVSMVGAILIARRRVYLPGVQAGLEPEVITASATPIDDNPHSIPVYGTLNPRQKEYPET